MSRSHPPPHFKEVAEWEMRRAGVRKQLACNPVVQHSEDLIEQLLRKLPRKERRAKKRVVEPRKKRRISSDPHDCGVNCDHKTGVDSFDEESKGILERVKTKMQTEYKLWTHPPPPADTISKRKKLRKPVGAQARYITCQTFSQISVTIIYIIFVDIYLILKT